MSKSIAITVAVVGLLLLMVLSSWHTRAEVEADLTERAQLELKRAGLTNLRLVPDGQELRLVGSVVSGTQRDLAVRSAQQVWGVTVVHDQLQVLPVAAVAESAAEPVVSPVLETPVERVREATAATEPPLPTAENCQRELSSLVRSEPIRFGFGQAQIDPASHALLAQLATTLIRCPYAVEVGGHTDSTGSVQANQWMSEQRALAVTAFLRNAVEVAASAQAVAQDRPQISARGYGSRQPIATNETRAGRRLNRRIEFTLSEGQE